MKIIFLFINVQNYDLKLLVHYPSFFSPQPYYLVILHPLPSH